MASSRNLKMTSQTPGGEAQRNSHMGTHTCLKLWVKNFWRLRTLCVPKWWMYWQNKTKRKETVKIGKGKVLRFYDLAKMIPAFTVLWNPVLGKSIFLSIFIIVLKSMLLIKFQLFITEKWGVIANEWNKFYFGVCVPGLECQVSMSCLPGLGKFTSLNSQHQSLKNKTNNKTFIIGSLWGLKEVT